MDNKKPLLKGYFVSGEDRGQSFCLQRLCKGNITSLLTIIYLEKQNKIGSFYPAGDIQRGGLSTKNSN
jgi:hypothetical protein